ncbi:Mur ligase family protein [Entomospira nematocerorum]|uniref:Dihydrofolate synthase/folylpolyglutamate synthase n=1 Tax=Entomospira nematocerorum TaxID=2719987 RepID=A0A968GG20_9SPIO|nr:cyanophycin synthetase [Entomospira nematocera]NIZ46491.1 hypothetical protein [Entomospira nematocera]WDI33708.1 Mur ligase family protein [Entomospira nematocera]
MSEYVDDLLSRRKNSLPVDNVFRFKCLLRFKNNIPKTLTNYKIIHIAGSKGKGSTAFYLSCMLQHLNRKTLLFTSPHLIDIRERFSYENRTLDDVMWHKSLHWLQEQEKILQIRLSFFDAMTILCFYIASQLPIDTLILETGLGGTWDATNICKPNITIITPIELEHTSILGDTIEAITQEKAGIIKDHTPIFMSSQSPQAESIIRKKAISCNAPLFSYKDFIHITRDDLIKNNALDFFYQGKEYHAIFPTPLITLADNALLSLIVTQYLYSHENIIYLWIKTIPHCFFPGRYQQIQSQPTPIILDGSHTTESLNKTSSTFYKQYQHRKRLLIFGCAQDKDFITMQQSFIYFDTIYLVNIKHTPNKMKEYASKTNLPYYDDLALLLTTISTTNFSEEQAILLTGSLYLVGEALTFYQAR